MKIIKHKASRSEYAFQDVITRLNRITKNTDLHQFMNDVRDQYGLKNLAYLGYNLGKLSAHEPFSIVTYSQNWVEHYRAKNYFTVDPVITEAKRSIVALDWRDIPIISAKVKKFFNEAVEAGVGRHGVSIPVGGRNKDYSIFSLTFDETGRDWYYVKNTYMRDFNIIAQYFHKLILDINKVEEPVFNISDRQRDVMFWYACGKSQNEIGMILGIAASTVHYHVTNILQKMNVVNMHQAIAKAMFYGLLPAPR